MTADPTVLAEIERLETMIVQLAQDLALLRERVSKSGEVPVAPKVKHTMEMGATRQTPPPRQVEANADTMFAFPRPTPTPAPAPASPAVSNVMPASTAESSDAERPSAPHLPSWAPTPLSDQAPPVSVSRVPLPRDAGRYTAYEPTEESTQPKTGKPPKARGSR